MANGMRPLMDLESWETFMAAAEAGSLAEAARSSGDPPSTVTRRIRALENALGRDLFSRSSHPARLTPFGEMVLKELKEPCRAFRTRIEALRSAQPSAELTVRISGPVGFLRQFAAPLMAEAVERVTPEVNVKLLSELSVKDLLEDRCDIVITPERITDQRVGSCAGVSATTVPLASPRYLEKHGEPRHPSELSAHTGILRSSRAYPRSQLLWHGSKAEAISWRKTFEYADMDIIREETAAGHGIAVDLPVSMAVEALRSKALVPILQGWKRKPWNFQIAYLRRSPAVSRIEPLALWLSSAIGQKITERRKEGEMLAGGHNAFADADPDLS